MHTFGSNIWQSECTPNRYVCFSVSDKETVEYKKLLGTKEGLYLGYTSGANVAAAVKLLQSGQLPPDAWVVTVLNDTGLKYPEIADYGFTDDDDQ